MPQENGPLHCPDEPQSLAGESLLAVMGTPSSCLQGKGHNGPLHSSTGELSLQNKRQTRCYLLERDMQTLCSATSIFLT